MLSRTLLVFFFSYFLLVDSLWAAIDVYDFDSEQQRQRYLQLSEELRCPKCQNQNLAGSNSQIAEDLRRETYRLIKDGKTDNEIKTAMVERYGEFVLYKPPLTSSTMILWGLPILMLLGGFLVVGLIIFRRQSQTDKTEALTDAETESLSQLRQNEEI